MNSVVKSKLRVFLKEYKDGKRTKEDLIKGTETMVSFWKIYHENQPLPDNIIGGLVAIRILKNKPNRWNNESVVEKV